MATSTSTASILSISLICGRSSTRRTINKRGTLSPVLHTTALFVLLATPTRTGSITSNFCSLATYSFYRDIFSVSLRFGERPPVFHNVLLTPARTHHQFFVCAGQFNFIEKLKGFGFDAPGHTDKHLVRFTLVFIEWIFLPVASQTNTLLQVVHGKQVIFPMFINDLQHDPALQRPTVLFADCLHFGCI